MNTLFAAFLVVISASAFANGDGCFQQDRATWTCDRTGEEYSSAWDCREMCDRPSNTCSMVGRGWTCNDGNETFFYTQEECVMSCN